MAINAPVKVRRELNGKSVVIYKADLLFSQRVKKNPLNKSQISGSSIRAISIYPALNIGILCVFVTRGRTEVSI
jgi:hypothetical protein